MPENPELDDYIEELKSQQRATVWPDTLRSGRTVDEFLWNGDPKATLTQRIGLVIFSLMALIPGAVMIAFVIPKEPWPLKLEFAPIALLGLAAGLRLLRNAFLHRPPHAHRDL